MARYIDADAATELLRSAVCTNCYSYNEIKCRSCEYDDAISYIDDVPDADVVPRVELDAMRGAANSYKIHYENLVRKICCEIEEEIVVALESNYKAKRERLANPHIDTADEFVAYCEGKITALRGIEDFIEELKDKYCGKDTNVPTIERSKNNEKDTDTV